MGEIRAIVTPAAKYTRDAADVLDECKRREFESVIVFGFKDGTITTVASANKSTLEVMGALEAAKTRLWTGA